MAIGGYEEDYLFDKSWIAACRNKLKDNGTIWISGTYHNIFFIARCLAAAGNCSMGKIMRQTFYTKAAGYSVPNYSGFDSLRCMDNGY